MVKATGMAPRATSEGNFTDRGDNGCGCDGGAGGNDDTGNNKDDNNNGDNKGSDNGT